METNLIEETFDLLKKLDQTKDPVKASLLSAQIAERSDEIGTVEGYAVRALDGELLVVCLEKSQAQAIQMALLMTGEGYVTHVSAEQASLEDFVHPEALAPEVVGAIFEGRSC